MKKILIYQKPTCVTCKKEKEFNLSKQKVGKPELIDLMLKDPNLIKRPILVDGKKVHFGFVEI